MVSANFRLVLKSWRCKLESQNLKLAKNKAGLGILNFEKFESLSLANQVKVKISMNCHKTMATTTAKQRATECCNTCSLALGCQVHDHVFSCSDF